VKTSFQSTKGFVETTNRVEHRVLETIRTDEENSERMRQRMRVKKEGINIPENTSNK